MHSISFSVHSISPSSSLLSFHPERKERGLFITGIFPAKNLFLLQF